MIEILKKLIRRFEGCHLVAYLCPAGIWTCGWGSTGKDVVKGTTWMQWFADDRMEKDAKGYANGVARISPVLLLYPDKHAAIADFGYNLGLTAYKASTLRKKIEAEDWEGAREQIVRWVNGGGRRLPGLVIRRQVEAELL